MDINSGRKCDHAGPEKDNSHSTARPKALTLIAVCLFLFFQGKAQFSQLEVSSAGIQSFFIAIDDSLSSDYALPKHLVTQLAVGNHSVWIITDEDYVNQRFEIELTEEKRFIYQLGITEGKLSLLPITVEDLDTLPPLPAKKPVKGQKNRKPEPILGRRMPGITLDSLLRMSQQKTYSGKLGCKSALSDLVFRQLIISIEKQDFENQRLVSVQDNISKGCVSVSQLSRLLDFIEFDDTKLRLISQAKGHIMDLDNLPQLEMKFSFNQSKLRLNQLLKDF